MVETPNGKGTQEGIAPTTSEAPTHPPAFPDRDAGEPLRQASGSDGVERGGQAAADKPLKGTQEGIAPTTPEAPTHPPACADRDAGEPLRQASGSDGVERGGQAAADKPLQRLAASFEELAAVAKQQQQPAGALEVGAFSRACSHVSVLIGSLGIAFKFAEMDYVAKVDALLEASKLISTLPSMVELDIQKGTVRQAGSHTRNLLRVKRGIDVVKVLFEQILVTEGHSLRDAAPAAYNQVLAPHHGWALRKAVAAGMYALPSNSQFLKKLNEDENSALVQMQNFIRSSGPVILYVEDLFTSRNLGIDW